MMVSFRSLGASFCFSKPRIPIAICAALIIFFSEGCGLSGTYTVPKADEENRVTSPNGQLDAVLVREDGGGAAGGWEWYVYIVAKGSPVVRPRSHVLFNAGTLTGERIIWTQEHLLEIHYEIASINQFTNIWGSSEIQKDAEGRNEYLVEIRLAPSSRDFSRLTPNGEFRQKY
jgi:hypothetical protein